MPTKATHVPKVREWLTSLGVLVAVSVSRQEAQIRLAAFLPLLVDRFPDGAFTTASLEYVAAQCVHGFPVYGELAAYLADWWKRNRRLPPALPPPPPIRQRGEPSDDEKAYASARVREIVEHLRSIAQPEEDWRRANRTPRYLTPEQLDLINPLPGGRRRVQASPPAADTPAAEDAWASSYANDAGPEPPDAS